MKITVIAAGFALCASLSGIARATGFNDSSPAIDTNPIRMERQHLNHVPLVHGFNEQSPHAVAARDATWNPDRVAVAVGANCATAPHLGFQDSTSFVGC